MMQNKHSTRHEIWLALIFIIASGMISFLHGLGTGWDFLDYHFYNGYAFIHHRLGFDLAPAGNWTYYNPLLDSLNYLMIRYLPAMLTTFLMGASCGLLGFFLYKIADLLFQGSGLKCRAFTIVSCIIGLTAPTIIPGIGSVMNDLQSLTPFIIALWMTLKALSEKQSRLFIFAAGLLNGLAPALKLTNIDYSFSLVLISFLFALTDKQQLRTAWLLSLGSFLAFILGEAWWMAILYQHFANPFFPYFNHFFHSPYFPDENLKADPRWGAHSLWGAIQLIFVLLKANHKVTDWFIQDWRFAGVLILGLCLCLWRLINRIKQTANRALSKPAIFLISFWFLAYFIWAFELGNYRFSAALELLSGPLIVFFYTELSHPFRFNEIGLAILTLIILSQTVYPNFNYAGYHGRYVEVTVPQTIPDHSMVIISGPLQSFVIPFFPKSIRFANPHAFLNSEDLSRQAILKQQGPLFILIGDYDDSAANHPWTNWLNETMQSYSLKITGSCQVIVSSVKWRGNFKLCPVSQ